MNKETVLAKLRASLSYSGATREWLESSLDLGALDGPARQEAVRQNYWFVDEDSFLGEFSHSIGKELVSAIQPPIREQFAEAGVTSTDLIEVRVADSYPGGSLILDILVVVQESAPAAYALLKGTSEIDKIAAGLKRQRDRLEELGRRVLRRSVAERLDETARRAGLPPPPADAVDLSLTIDARPMEALRPGTFSSHRIDLGISLGYDALSLENRGEDPLEDLQLGVFTGGEPRHSWSFGDAYRCSVPALGAGQTLSKSEVEFRDSAGSHPDLASAAYVDCWVQDRNGIYLFQFRQQQA